MPKSPPSGKVWSLLPGHHAKADCVRVEGWDSAYLKALEHSVGEIAVD